MQKPIDSGPSIGCLIFFATIALHGTALFALVPSSLKEPNRSFLYAIIPIVTGATSAIFTFERYGRTNKADFPVILGSLSIIISLLGLLAFLPH